MSQRSGGTQPPAASGESTPATDKIVGAIQVIRRPLVFSDFGPLGIAAGAGAVWTTVTIGP